MKVRILSSAFGDLERGRKFYDKQAERLGSYFFDSIFADIDSLALYGGIHYKFRGYHRLLAKRFPYAIYYRIETDNSVLVYRVLDCRQDPAKTRRALPKD